MELRIYSDGRCLAWGRQAGELGRKWSDCTLGMRPRAARYRHFQRECDHSFWRYVYA
jgi:hypothetical protein